MNNHHRAYSIIKQLINQLNVDLSNLTVLTEAASGAYLYTPLLAALAGAKKVLCYTRDSHFASKQEVRDATLLQAKMWNLENNIEIIFEKNSSVIASADIITNSGLLRPIDHTMIFQMKSTAVIPLMWETWEYRSTDLDLNACREANILVLGTNESKPPCDLKPVAGYLALKLLFELGLEGDGVKTILLGGQETLGASIYHCFTKLNLEVAWFGNHAHSDCNPYHDLAAFFEKAGDQYDLIIVAEHHNDILLLGAEGLLTYEKIQLKNPALALGIISGNVDRTGLKHSKLHYFPKNIQPFGCMSYQAYSLGLKPVLQLYAAGLKVGEMMARARLQGFSVKEAAQYAIEHSPAMDFKGEYAWL